MFYCEPCRTENDWPKSIMRWRSVCERCDKYSDDCNDIPSVALGRPLSAEQKASLDALSDAVQFAAASAPKETK